MVKCCIRATISAKPSCSAEHVGVARLVEAPVRPVEYGMSGFVGDDIVREAGVDAAAGHVIAGIVCRSLEVAEQQRDVLRTIESVGLPQRVRPNGQLRCTKRWSSLCVPCIRRRPPKDRPAQGTLKVLDGLHAYGVDHLLVKLRVALRWRPAILREQAAGR